MRQALDRTPFCADLRRAMDRSNATPATPVPRGAPLAWFGGALMLGATMWLTGIFALIRAVQALIG